VAISVTYALNNGILESIHVINVGDTTSLLTLFLYTDLDVNADPINTATGGVNGILQTQGNTTVDVRPVRIVPNAFQIAFFPDLLNSLNDGVATNLNNSGNGLGPANLSHAFQWDLALGGGMRADFEVVKDVKELTQVPAPASLRLLFGGLLVVGALRRRRGGQA
jgi:hypothetical protein